MVALATPVPAEGEKLNTVLSKARVFMTQEAFGNLSKENQAKVTELSNDTLPLFEKIRKGANAEITAGINEMDNAKSTAESEAAEQKVINAIQKLGNPDLIAAYQQIADNVAKQTEFFKANQASQ